MIKDLRRIDRALRNTAERHPEDTIANSASALAVKLESLGTEFGTRLEDITETDKQLMRYVVRWCKDNKELWE